MKRLLIAIYSVLLLTSSAWGAELLVQANDSPFEKGAKKGDIIVVRPDGWKWGKEENLPRYIVVKLPGVKIEDAKKYEEPLTKMVDKEVDGKIVQVPEMVKKRKYNIEAATVDSVKFTGQSVLSVDSKDVASAVAAIKEKTLAVVDEK